MLTQEALVEIHVLHRQGESIRAIAQKLNLSRNTVRRYLRDLSAAPSYPDRPQRATKLDPYKDYLLTRIEAARSEEHTSELQSRPHLVCRLLLEKKKQEGRSTREARVIIDGRC